MFRFLLSDKSSQTERRREPRVAIFTFADICDADGNPIIEATMRELSNHGAYLRLKSGKRLPENLIIRSRIGQKSHPAKLKWMSGVGIGVEFDQKIGTSGNK